MTTVSVLMSTYASESAANLAELIESIYAQTAPPDQLVLVVDGPVPAAQDKVINSFCGDSRIRALTLVRLPSNQGLAGAMNAGLEACSGEWIARMDSDDISLPDRLRLQVRYADEHPDTDVISCWSEEFFPDEGRSEIKVSPVAHDDVVTALRWRNVLVHPTILMKSAALRAVGAYSREFRMLEDYDLFVRLAMAGYRFHVLPKTLVRVRSSVAQRTRRGGIRYCLDEISFRRECWRRGFLRPHEFAATAGLYVAFRLMSGPLRKRVYALARS